MGEAELLLVVGLGWWAWRRARRVIWGLGEMKSLIITAVIGVVLAVMSAWEPGPAAVQRTVVVRNFPQVIQPEFPAQAKP